MLEIASEINKITELLEKGTFLNPPKNGGFFGLDNKKLEIYHISPIIMVSLGF